MDGRRILVTVGAIAALALPLAACGSSGGSTSTSAGGPAASGSSSGGDIKIMAISVLQSSALSFPDESAAMQAHADQINAAGGINGKKLDLIICNDQFDPNVASDCARKAASEGVVAVIQPFEPYTQQVDPILQAAGIPMVYGEFASTTDGTSPISFLRDAGVPGGYAAVGIQLAKEGCKKIGAVVVQEVNNLLGATWIENGAKSQGAAFIQTPVTQDQADFSAPVAELISQGADCIVPDTLPQQGAKVVAAVAQSGHSVKLGAISTEFAGPQIAALGAAANGMILAGQNYLPTDTTVPAVQDVITGMKKYTPGVSLDDSFGIDGWASVSAVEQLLKSVSGPVTAATVMKAAGTATYNTGLLATFSAADKAPVSSYPRAVNWSYLVWTVKDGKAVLNSPQFVPIASGL